MAPNSSPKFARLNTLKALKEGSMLNRSVSLMGQASVVLTSRKIPLPTGFDGGGARYGLVACSACNCPVVNRPAPTNACPAGVSVPASVLFHELIALTSPVGESERINCPGFPTYWPGDGKKS